MPTITLSKKVLQTIAPKVEEKELLKGIDALGAKLEGQEGDALTVEVCPNRPDLLSEQGLGRALASYFSVSVGLKKYEVLPPKNTDMRVVVEKSAKNVRPYTACAVVTGLHFDDEKIKEIVQIQEKLHITYGRNRKKCAIGVYPLEKITFPIRFIGEDPKKISFTPLEGKKMTGLQVLSQHPTGREYAHLLEGYEKFPFFIDAKGEVLSMPPIINSHNVGKITETTTDVFVECSGFDQQVLDICLHMIVATLADMGGKIHGVHLVNEHAQWKKTSPAFQSRTIAYDTAYINTRLGTTFKDTDVKKMLERMGYGVDVKKKEVQIPAYRADVLHQIDLIEDIAIAYGFDKFTPQIPHCATVGHKDAQEMYKEKIAHILAGLGIFESNTYCLIGETQTKATSDDSFVRLANSVAEGYDTLRNSVIASLLLVLQNNRNRDYPQSFFEVGTIFKPDQTQETKIKESKQLGYIYADPKADYTVARQIADYLFTNLHITPTFKATTKTPKLFMHGRCAEILMNDELLGCIGQIHPAVLESYALEMPAVGFLLDFAALTKHIQ